jgi:hypothetical protein
MCWVSFTLFSGDFFIDLYSVDSDEAMKRGDEALSASLLQFLSIIKASSLYYANFFSAFSTSSP